MSTGKRWRSLARVMFVLQWLLGASLQAADEPATRAEAEEEWARIDQISSVIESDRLPPSDLAEALRMRGVMLGNLYAHEKALRDFTQSLTLDAKNPVTYVDRGVVLHKLKDYDGASRDFQKAIALAPDNSNAYYSRGMLYYYQARYKQAKDDFESGVSLAKVEDAPYGMLWLYMTLAKLGADGKTALADYAVDHDLKQWPGAAIELLLEKKTPQEVLAAAANEDKKKERLQLCEAHFYVGQYHLLGGDTAKAREAFEKVLDTKVREYLEYQYAAIELERLKR
jgi:lipoprotein NlpI